MKQKLFEHIGGNTFKITHSQPISMINKGDSGALGESEKMNPELIRATWEDDKDGEYIQINPDDSVVYVANGNAMETIAPKGSGKDMFRRIGSWIKMNNFHPNIWKVNDHGNVELLSSSGKYLGGLV